VPPITAATKRAILLLGPVLARAVGADEVWVLPVLRGLGVSFTTDDTAGVLVGLGVEGVLGVCASF